MPEVCVIKSRMLTGRDGLCSIPDFRTSGRLREMLRYTVEESLNGRAEELKETVIGLDVFERDTSYDPRIDPVVRVMAGRLRNRLAEYYGAEGIGDPLRIEYPKGTYAPNFQLQEVNAFKERIAPHTYRPAEGLPV